MDSFFQTLQDASLPIREVTKGAFCQARNKLSHKAFCELNQHLLAFVKQHSSLRTWHGYRLLAIDGSTLQIPRETKHFFDPIPSTENDSQPLARISQLFDVLNKLTIHAGIHPYRIGEREMAMYHGPFLQTMDLLLLDRGYPSFYFFAWVLSLSAQFCARVPHSLSAMKEVRLFYLSGEKVQIVTLHPNDKARSQCRFSGLPLTPIRVRLIRLSFPGAEDSVVITSLLDSKLFPAALFSDLYHGRWNIEECYKTMKSRLEIENFSGKSVESVHQDFHAKILSMNLAAVLVRPAQDQLDREKALQQPHPLQINFTFALSCLKNTIVRLFQQEQIHDLLRELFELFRRTAEPIRPGRSFPRKKKRRERPVFYPCYKSTS